MKNIKLNLSLLFFSVLLIQGCGQGLRAPSLTNHPKAADQSLALILPTSGAHGKSATLIQNGFLAAYFNYPKSANLAVHLIDSTKSGITEALAEARKLQANKLVGPLTKQDLEALKGRSQGFQSVLALNIPAEARGFANNTAFFGLNPEEEAKAIARKAFSSGHNQALAIVSKDELGQRSYQAFKHEYESLGGELSGVEFLGTQHNNSQAIENLLQVTHVEIQELEAPSAPNIRTDVDCLFLAGNASLARQIKPLLNYHYAGHLPIFASATIYEGTWTQNLNKDLDNIVFCDMPYILNKANTLPSAIKIDQRWHDKLPQNERLFALGYDAFNLAVEHEQWQSLEMQPFKGLTGNISYLPEQSLMLSEPVWAKFKLGRPQLLPS